MSKENKAGRPTKYKEEYSEQVEKLCRLGSTDEDIADFFNVSVATIGNWKNDYSGFLEAIKRGKVVADAEVADRLYKRATGYSHPDVHVSNFQGEVTLTPIKKNYPPDTTAAIFWLKNRQKEYWRDKQHVEQSGSVSVAIADILGEIDGTSKGLPVDE